MRLQNKVAIVTGAASGFGAAIARTYVEHGARVAIADINQEGAQALASELGDHAIAVRCDVSRKEDIEALVEQCVNRFGTLDIVVNNAGTTHRNQPLLNVDEATFDRIFAVNVKSLYHMTFAVLPIFRARRAGVILNVGSVAGIRPRPGLTWYNASKGAVNTLSKSMAAELGPDGIRVNAICPVMGATGLLEAFMGMPDTPENRQKFLASIPLGRLAESQDVANAALFLASDEAAFITGVEFPVDGGRIV
ncbi:SDR family oxidoreductase [Methyloversatilis thermotolerans]|uniref:SDR family oxidoreductase n=1 Tax=Methyloversatilis thermotolerans TaxID=1346290 RepID=UPI000475F553|nr:SDR family oxidoreductase [Methyloversatilis thermotolerans]